jgi:hypothetical protein
MSACPNLTTLWICESQLSTLAGIGEWAVEEEEEEEEEFVIVCAEVP